MNNRRPWLALAVTAVLALAGGCYESTDVEIYEPHVYKGKRDSDHILQSPPALEEQLSQRLQRGQTDR